MIASVLESAMGSLLQSCKCDPGLSQIFDFVGSLSLSDQASSRRFGVSPTSDATSE
jgi:hypothetical protein